MTSDIRSTGFQVTGFPNPSPLFTSAGKDWPARGNQNENQKKIK